MITWFFEYKKWALSHLKTCWVNLNNFKIKKNQPNIFKIGQKQSKNLKNIQSQNQSNHTVIHGIKLHI